MSATKLSATVPCPTCARIFKSVEARNNHVAATHENPDWVAGRNQTSSKSKSAPICPVCEMPAPITATRFGPRAECCGLLSWGLKPLVTPATMTARKSAHAAFDLIWKSGSLSRGEAYRRLALAMGMTATECHISKMTEEQAKRVVEVVRSGGIRENEKGIAA
jgi:hypothetical protein